MASRGSTTAINPWSPSAPSPLIPPVIVRFKAIVVVWRLSPDGLIGMPMSGTTAETPSTPLSNAGPDGPRKCSGTSGTPGGTSESGTPSVGREGNSIAGGVAPLGGAEPERRDGAVSDSDDLDRQSSLQELVSCKSSIAHFRR